MLQSPEFQGKERKRHNMLNVSLEKNKENKKKIVISKISINVYLSIENVIYIYIHISY